MSTAQDGTQILMRSYAKEGAEPGPAVPFFHGGGYVISHLDTSTGQPRATR